MLLPKLVVTRPEGALENEILESKLRLVTVSASAPLLVVVLLVVLPGAARQLDTIDGRRDFFIDSYSKTVVRCRLVAVYRERYGYGCTY